MADQQPLTNEELEKIRVFINPIPLQPQLMTTTLGGTPPVKVEPVGPAEVKSKFVPKDLMQVGQLAALALLVIMLYQGKDTSKLDKYLPLLIGQPVTVTDDSGNTTVVEPKKVTDPTTTTTVVVPPSAVTKDDLKALEDRILKAFDEKLKGFEIE